jgi:hypothetical protein
VKLIIAAVHESLVGTNRTWCDVRYESAFGGKAEVGLRDRQVERTLNTGPPPVQRSFGVVCVLLKTRSPVSVGTLAHVTVSGRQREFMGFIRTPEWPLSLC